jgi:antitoxin ParD1/3/4
MSRHIMINVSIPDELDRFVSSRIDSGEYRSASEVVCDGLRLLEERERARQSDLAELRDQIAVGLDQARRGELLDGDEVMARLMERHERRLHGLETAEGRE